MEVYRSEAYGHPYSFTHLLKDFFIFGTKWNLIISVVTAPLETSTNARFCKKSLSPRWDEVASVHAQIVHERPRPRNTYARCDRGVKELRLTVYISPKKRSYVHDET
jgi:hypothetical protein